MPDGLRAVLDTNILVRAVLRPAGPAGLVFDAFRAGSFEMVTSAAALRANLEVEAIVVPSLQ